MGRVTSRVAIAVVAAVVLTPLLTLPLGWQEQAVFATALILIAAVLNRTLHTTTITLVLMAMSVFSTLRYGYWRTTQTWDGITSAGHFQQSDTIFVLLMLAAEFYAFTMLILGYFQTLHPLGRQPVALPADSLTWPSVDVFIPTYNEPLTVVRATVLGALAMDYPAGKMRVALLGRRQPGGVPRICGDGGRRVSGARLQHAREGGQHQQRARPHDC